MVQVAVHLVRVQQLVLPRALPVVGADPALRVDPQLDLAEEVVAVARDALDDPELPLRERAAHWRPGDALPAILQVAGGGQVLVPDLAEAVGRLLPLELAAAAVDRLSVDEAEP